jgi:hypothetical protein
VRVEISFEVERDKVPPRQELEAAFRGATSGVLKIGENFYAGHMKAAIVRKPRKG